VQRAHPLMMLFSSALAGSIVGFLFYNFNPASIFMGDTGSMFLGFVLAATSIQTNQKSSTVVAVLIPAIALGLPIMDTLLAIGRRALRGRPLFQADKEHIHHRLMAAGLSHRQAVLVLYGLCIFLGGIALVLTYASSGQSTLLLIVVALVALVFLRSLGYMRFAGVSASAIDRKRNRALRGALRPLGRRLRMARASDEMWPVVIEAAGILEAASVRLLAGMSGADPTEAFSHGFDGGGGFQEGVRFMVPGGKAGETVLELAWADGRREVDRDTEIAIDIFCEHLGDALELASVVPVGLPAERALKRRV
jgi:UDP-GlcNAc:undecaprenyl-phosphate GlcNAc-1-phosphate transferase